MYRKSVLWVVLFVLTLGLILITPRFVAGQNPQVAQGMMDSNMMHGGNRSGDMNTIHQLFANHNLIHRTVKEIPGGHRTITESDDPQIAALIQQHVASMYQRVADGRDFSMMSQTLPAMFHNRDRYQRKFEITPKGVVITETSNDPNMVAVIREHGREVSRFVAEGMSAMMEGMMK